MTPNPPRLCPFQPQSPPSALVGGNPMPEGIVCSSRCALFVTTADEKGRPNGGGCALVYCATGLIQLHGVAHNLLALAIEQKGPDASNATPGAPPGVQ